MNLLLEFEESGFDLIEAVERTFFKEGQDGKNSEIEV